MAGFDWLDVVSQISPYTGFLNAYRRYEQATKTGTFHGDPGIGQTGGGSGGTSTFTWIVIGFVCLVGLGVVAWVIKKAGVVKKVFK